MMGNEKKNKLDKKCFIVTPIGDSDSEIRRHIDGIIDQAIIPALDGKFEITVAHRKYEVGSITNAIIKDIIESDLVIANLTRLNPNVMFELAIRYSFGKPAIVIAERNTKLPFDINSENTIFYVNDPAGAAELRESISKFEESIDYKRTDFGPVHDAVRRISVLKASENLGNNGNNMDSYILESIDNLERKMDRVLSLVDKSKEGNMKINDYINYKHNLIDENSLDNEKLYHFLNQSYYKKINSDPHQNQDN